MTGGRFEVICEIEPPTSADMGIVREQIAVLRRTCDAFLVPDSHLGRATGRANLATSGSASPRT